MTFRNKHSLVSGFLSTIIFISGACALGGCVETTEPQGIDSTDEGERMPLTIRATVSDYVAIGEDGAPTTRIPTEEDYTTKFNDGDAIGIFAVRDLGKSNAAIIDDINNLKLLYTNAADGGTGSWTPEDPTKVLYSYYNEVTYIAYYPYHNGVSITITQSEEQILQSLADNAKLQPATDQSTPEAYTGSDLMAAFTKPATDPTDANKKVLTLNFEHLHALLILKTKGLVNCVAPAGSGFEYSDRVLGVDAAAKDAVINGIKALPMGDGTFRAIVKTTSTDVIPTGSYTTVGDKTILYTGAALTAGTLIAGKCYTQQVEVLLPTNGSVTRTLQVGDYYCRDGKILAHETPVIKKPSDCIGIVTLLASGSDANFGGNCVDNKIRGHVVSVYEVANCAWGPANVALAPTSQDINNDVGYLNTQFMKQTAENDYGSLSTSNFAAAYHCLNYGTTDRGRLQTDKNSGWYFPSWSFMWALTVKPTAVMSSFDKLVAAGYGQNLSWGQYCWTSSTAGWTGPDGARIVKLGDTGSYKADRSNLYWIRAELTF